MECSICIEFIEKEFTLLPCNHVFHSSCIKKWIDIKKSCPMCRKKFFTKRIRQRPTFNNAIVTAALLNWLIREFGR